MMSLKHSLPPGAIVFMWTWQFMQITNKQLDRWGSIFRFKKYWNMSIALINREKKHELINTQKYKPETTLNFKIERKEGYPDC